MPYMSRSQIKEEIFDHLAEHFENTGTTTSISSEEAAEALEQNIGRVRKLIAEMVKEGVLVHDPELGEGQYKLAPIAYVQLVQGLAMAGRLPPPLKDDQGNEIGWINPFSPTDD